MQVVERSALVTYTPAQMFALVNDVPRYPEFLPWCIAVRVQDVSATESMAALKIAHGVLQTEFTTRNTLGSGRANSYAARCTARFAISRAQWRFEAIGTRGSRVNFQRGIRVQEPADRRRLQCRVRDRCAAESWTPSYSARKQVYG